MNEIDRLKELRLEEEKTHINDEFVEELAQQLIDKLVEWSNNTIFEPHGGKLSFAMTLGKPNAGVSVHPSRPFHPQMEFRTSLISDLYADAFTFPLVCRRIETETETLSAVHQMEMFQHCRVRFSESVPPLNASNVTALFRPACETLVGLLQGQGVDGPPLRPDDVRCRFIMFELMLVWTFFHELGHVVQRHYLLRSQGIANVHDESLWELEEEPTSANTMMASQNPGGPAPTDLSAQARELLADADATDLTLKYLVMQGRLNFGVWYLLLCSMGCMFQRFYSGYQDNLSLTPGRHPHPLVRDEAAQLLGNNWVTDYLVASKNIKSREEARIPLAYLSSRACLMTGLFRSHRVEKREGPEQLPSYMALSLHGGDQVRAYLKALLPEIERQMPIIVKEHLVELHSLEYWLQQIRAFAH